MNPEAPKKAWGGRFSAPTADVVERYTHSLHYDSRLWDVDIQGSIAHARMLGEQSIIPPDHASQIVAGLQKLRGKFAAGAIELDASCEDIHMFIEQLLFAEIGDVAGKLHTARSRNDQVATDTRLYLRGVIGEISDRLRNFQHSLIKQAQEHLNTLLPGYTHLQHAQPIFLTHHLMAYFWMAERDVERLADAGKRVNVLPLGSAAMAGTSFPIDREFVRHELGFAALSENSMDAVSDRDYIVEFLAAASLIMVHLSRLSEDLILWSAPEFGFVSLHDSVTTGSSIMPQKKNPDVAELTRGKTGRVFGDLLSLLTTIKGLPLSYNRDLQEDKEPLFDAIDTVMLALEAMSLVIQTAEFNDDRMEQSVTGDFSTATDLADYLVRRGVPFRTAHEVVGKLVGECVAKGVSLESISTGDLELAHSAFGSDAHALLDPTHSASSRNSHGGTGHGALAQQLQTAKALLDEAAKGQ